MWVVCVSKFSQLVGGRDDLFFPQPRDAGLQSTVYHGSINPGDAKWAEYRRPYWGNLLGSETPLGLDDFGFS